MLKAITKILTFNIKMLKANTEMLKATTKMIKAITKMIKMFKKSDLNAEQVAAIIYQQAQQRKFLILTHKLGKQAYLMKKLMPIGMYIKNMQTKTQSMQRLLNKK